MGQGLGYKVDVAAIPTEILSKHLLRSEKNAVGRRRDGKEFHDGVFLDAFQLLLLSISLKLLCNRRACNSFLPSKKSTSTTPLESQKTVAITFLTDLSDLNLIGSDYPRESHCLDCCFVSGSY